MFNIVYGQLVLNGTFNNKTLYIDCAYTVKMRMQFQLKRTQLKSKYAKTLKCITLTCRDNVFIMQEISSNDITYDK